MRIVVYNLGCKVNQYESDAIVHELLERGHEVSTDLGYAELYILNTCAVTNEAERKSRQAVSRCRKYNEDARIVICGCASENNTNQFVGKDGVTYISGVANKSLIPDMIGVNAVNIGDLPTVYEDDLTPNNARTRAYLKVQDGCNNYCSYCLIPYLRGRSRSRDIESITKEANRLSQLVGEIVITGINLSAYGEDCGSSLKNLILSLKDLQVRIRLGSLEVNVIDEEFLAATTQLYAFCPQFHLSLQSGDDETLKAMNRHYTTQEYYEKVQLIRKYYPLAGITTDLICAYPTETEEQFSNTLRFMERVKFSDMHIFIFSKREGTRASKLKMIETSIAKNRAVKAEEIAKINKNDYLKMFVGKSLEVLLEENNSGYSREYIRVHVDGKEGETIIVVPSEVYADGLK